MVAVAAIPVYAVIGASGAQAGQLVAQSGSSPVITSASGSPADASSVSVSVTVGTSTTNLNDDTYTTCRVYINNNSGPTGPGSQSFAASGSWQGTVQFAPGQTLYAQLAISKDGCSTFNYSNIVSFSVAAYQGGTTTGATTTTPAPAPTTAPTTTAPSGPPTPSFTTSVNGLSVTFADTSTAVGAATISHVSWSFGDGANSTGSPATHPFLATGTYVVIETVIDSNGLTAQTSSNISVQGYDPRAKLPASITDRHDVALTAAATTLKTAVPVKVFCGRSPAGWRIEVAKISKTTLGYAILGSHQAHVWPAGCATLDELAGAASPAKFTSAHLQAVALALLVTVHEIGHADGVAGERQADCYGLANMNGYAVALGLKARSSLAAAHAAAVKLFKAKATSAAGCPTTP